MATNVPDIVEYYRKAKGSPYVVFEGPTLTIPTDGRIPTQSIPMRQGMHTLAMEVRLTANITCEQSSAAFLDAMLTEVFEDLTFRDESGSKIQFWADSHVLKNNILAFNDELIVTPTNLLTSSATALNYRERFYLPLCFLDNTSRYYTMTVETGNVADVLSTTTDVTLNSLIMDVAYIYTDCPLIDWKSDSHTINGNTGSNDFEQNCTEGPTQMFIFHSDNQDLWDEYHPYQAVQGANSNIDDVDMLSADGVQKNCEGYTAFQEFAELWLNEFRTFMPIYSSDGGLGILLPSDVKKNYGFYTQDLILTYDPPFYASKNVRMRLELVAADNALHYAQILVGKNNAEHPGSHASTPLSTDGGSVQYPTDSKVKNVPASEMVQRIRTIPGADSVSRPPRLQNKSRKKLSLRRR